MLSNTVAEETRLDKKGRFIAYQLELFVTHFAPFLVHPQAFDVHVVSFIPMKLNMEEFTEKTQADWFIYQGPEKLVEVFRGTFSQFQHVFFHCLSRCNLHCEIGSCTVDIHESTFILLTQICFDLGFK